MSKIIKPVLVVKNCTREGPGIFEIMLKEKKIAVNIVDLDKKEFFPPLKDFSALIVLGGPDSANDQSEKMNVELGRVKEALAMQMPYLGICLGMQILVKAAGGKVVKNPVKEIGFRDSKGNLFMIELTKDGQKDPFLADLGAFLNPFHLHGETVVLTEKMKLLGVGKFCQNQIVKVMHKAYGIQGHFELTREMFERLISEDPDLLKMNKNDLKKDFSLVREEYTRIGRRVFENFLKLVGY